MVLMSVDAKHQGEVCALLKEKFSNTQFIFTTYDEIWLKHMKSEGLIKGRNFSTLSRLGSARMLAAKRSMTSGKMPCRWTSHRLV